MGTLTQSVAQFRSGSTDKYDLARSVESFVRSLIASPEPARASTLSALASGKDPVLGAFAKQLQAALAGDAKATVAIAADAVVKQLETKDPVKAEKAFVSAKQHAALVSGIRSGGTAEALNTFARQVAGELPAAYKKAFEAERKQLIAALEGFSKTAPNAAYALVAVNVLAAQRYAAGDHAGAAGELQSAIALMKQGKGLTELGLKAAEALSVKTPIAAAAPSPVQVGEPVTLSAEARTRARREIRAGAAKDVFPSLTGNNCGTHGYIVTGETAKILLEMARGRSGDPVDARGMAVLALLDTADESQIFMTLVSKDGHVANVGQCWHDELSDYAVKVTKNEDASGFHGAYLLLKDAEYFGLGAKGRPTDDFDIKQYKD